MRREVRATANRLANFDDANLRRSARAAVAAAARVERALEILGDEVPDHLISAGQLRVTHRQASLEELGKLADPPMTKDAVAGRIRRLLSMADKMTTSITTMQGSSVEHPGRVVAALAADPRVMDRSGGEFVTTELAMEYGITDVDGSVIPSARATRGSPIWKPIREVNYRGQ